MLMSVNVWGETIELYRESFVSKTTKAAAATASKITATQSMFYDNEATVWSHYITCSNISKNNTDTHTSDNYCKGKTHTSIQHTAGAAATDYTILEVTDINIEGATELKLNYAFYFNGGTNYKAFAKIDNGAYTQIATATNGTKWQYVTDQSITGTGAKLSLKFTYKSNKMNNVFYLDEIYVYGTSSASKTPLTTPTGLTVGTTTSTTAAVSWNSVTDAGSYKVEYKTSSASNWTAVSPNPTTTSCTITGLTSSITYNWRVTAIPSASAVATKDNSSAANGDNIITTAPASHDIFWYANGQQVAKNNQQEGAALTIPADPNPSTYCYGKTFVGWTATQNYSHATAAPGDLFTSKDSKTVGSTTAYYAVFADADGGDEFYMYYNNGGTKTYVGAISGDYLSAQTTKSNAVPYTIDNDGYLSYTIGSTTTYVTHTTTGDTKVATGTSQKLTITKTGTTIKLRSTKQDTRYLQYSSSGGGRFQFTASDATLSWESAISYSNYTTTCAAVYEATVADGILNGSVVISKTDDAAAGATSLTGLHEGDKVYIFPTANTGYNIESVIVNETPISAQSGKYSYTIGEAGITVSATFAAKQTLDITANAPDGGTYTIQVDDQNAITVTSAQNISAYEGAVITMTSTADDTHKLQSTPFEVKDADGAKITPSKSGDNYTFTMPNKGVTVTAKYSATYSITAAECTNGSITKITDKDDNVITRTSQGSKVIVNLSANNHYHIKSVYYIKDGDEAHTDIAEDEGGYSFTMVASNITIYAEFEEDPTCTVQFLNSGTPLGNLTREVYVGEGIGTIKGVETPLPTLTEADACDPHSRTFVGWMIGTIDGKQQSAPAMVSASTPVTEAMTLNAVWAEEKTGDPQFQKVTSTDKLEDGDYIMAGYYTSGSKYYAMKNATVSGGYYMDRVEVTPQNDVITTANTALIWKLTFDKTNKNVTFYNEALTSNNYLSAYKSGSYNNFRMSSTAYNFKYSQDANTSGAWKFEASTLTGQYITYYQNSTKDYFNLYTAQSNPNYLYKQLPSLTNYITKCSTDPLIEVSPTELTNFSTVATTGNPSVAQSFTVEGYNLTEDITVSAPEGYEVCRTEAGTYSASVTLPQSDGKVAKTPVYVRLAAAETAAASVTGSISLTSTDATTKNVALTGEVIAAVTVTFKNNDSTTDAPAAIKLGKGGTLGSNLPGVGSMTAPISGYTFVGWVADGDKWNGFTPSLTKSLITGTDPINADVTYDAVWAKGGNDFEIMGNSDPFTDGNYIITYYSSYYGLQAMGNVVSGSNITTIEVDDQDEGIISNNTEAKVVWTLHKTGTNTVTFYNADKGQYLQGTSSALSFTNTPVDWTWSMTPGEEGYAPKYKFSIGTNGLYYLSNEFQYHSSPDPLYIYKQQLNNFFVTTPNEYTVIWHKGNAETAISSAFEGQTFADIVADAPSVDDEAAGDCANKFMGWATAAITKDEATESDVQWADNTTPISGDVEYYAVFAYQEGSATNYTLTIGTSDVPTSYTATNKTLTAKDDNDASNTMDVTLQFEGVMLNQNSKIQVRKKDNGTGFIYNTTNLGSVTSISAGDLNTYYGNAEHPTSGSTAGTPYFTIGNTSNTETLSEIVVKYTIGSATYSNYVTQCTPKYDVKFYTDNGTTQYGETQSIEENGYATAPAIDPENDCSDFKGWSKTWGGDVVNVGEVQITEPTNFYAVWDAIKPVLEAEFPKDNVATQGSDAADLKVEVTAPTAGTCLTYQWQKSTNATTGFEDISGATASTYTPSTVEANTTYYRCVVTNGNKSTPSRVATISVVPVTKCFAPSISIATGKAGFIRSTLVTLTTETEGATIYYTTDGTTTPSAETSKYTAPFTITDNTTIQAIAIKAEMTNSDVATATFYKAELQNIEVETAPAKVTYDALETFDPTGLVITANYNYELSEEVEYNEASKNDFSFNPALTTPLNVGDNEITIIYGGQEATQAITVNCIAIAAPAPSQPEAKQFTEVTIEWAVDEHADHYELSWEGGAAEIVTSPYKKEGLTHSTTYHYTLTAVGKTNYCNATAENQEAKTKNRMLTGIDDTKPIICTHGNYFAGQTIKNSDFTVTLLYNNGDTELGNPNYVGLSEPVSTTKETDALTEDQEGQLTVYLKSGSTTVSTTVTVANPSVTFNVPSGTEAPAAIHRGDNYPSMPNITDCGDNEYDYTFVGWVENTVDEETTTEPENIITAGTTCEITTDQVVYALYKRTFNDEENATWSVITNKAGIISGETYLVINNDNTKAYNGEISGGHLQTVAVSLTGTISVTNAREVVLTKVGTSKTDSIFSIKDKTTEKYIVATDDKSGSFDNSANADSYGWKFTNANSNAGLVVQYQGGSEVDAYFRYFSSTPTFRTYGSTDNSPIRLAKKVPTINTYYITTPNCAKRKPVSLDLDITNVQREFYVNDAFNSNNLVVTAHFDNEDVEDVSASEFTSVTAPDMTTATEEATVTVSYTENEEKVSKTYTVLIKERVASVVTLVSAGRESTLEGQHYTGEQVNLPTEPSLTVKGYEFMGWSTEEIETPSSCPTTGFYAGGASFNLTQPAYTFYAVYALGAGSASDNDKFGLSIVTDPAGLVDGGMYMFTIANTSNTLAATTVSNSAIQTVTDFKTEQLQGNESYIWKLSASDDNTFKMQMSDAKYLSNTSSTNVSAQNNATDAVSWTLSYGTNSELGWRIQNTNTSGRFLGLSESGTTIKAYSPSDNNNWGKYPHVFTIYRLMGGYTTAPTLVVDGTDVTEIPEDFNGHVIVEEEGDVTLDAATTWKNLTIKNGAKVTTNAALTIKDLLIETKMGAGTGKKTSPNIPASCGQLIIKEGGSVTANGTAIVENQIDPSGVASYGWYTFSVPFPVDALNGIYDTKGNKLINEYDYAIMDYHGDIRAQGQYGWKKYRGILQPGVMYAITVADTDFGTLRFKKTTDGALVAANAWTASIYGGGEETDANWNAIGNPNLAIAQFVNNSGATTLQLYNHTTNAFTGYGKGDLNIVVGSGFFIQAVASAKSITMKVEETTTGRGYRAPAREVEKEEPFIAVQLLQGEAMNDQVFINASDEATATYEIGRDVAKAFMDGEVKCAQLYVPAYGTKLCAADFQLNSDDEAMFPLTITAPKAGTYTLALDNAQKNATVYLMQNGAIIWNLSQGAYEMDLAKGTNNEYTLVMKVDKSDVITGSDVINTQADGIQKFIYDEKLILIHNGNVYNGAGARMK